MMVKGENIMEEIINAICRPKTNCRYRDYSSYHHQVSSYKERFSNTLEELLWNVPEEMNLHNARSRQMQT